MATRATEGTRAVNRRGFDRGESWEGLGEGAALVTGFLSANKTTACNMQWELQTAAWGLESLRMWLSKNATH